MNNALYELNATLRRLFQHPKPPTSSESTHLLLHADPAINSAWARYVLQTSLCISLESAQALVDEARVCGRVTVFSGQRCDCERVAQRIGAAGSDPLRPHGTHGTVTVSLENSQRV